MSGWAGSTSFSLLPLGIWYTIGDTSKAPQTVYQDEVFSYKRRRKIARQAKDAEREARIRREISVDAYSPEEQAVGWYNFLADTLHFPFTAHCVARRAISPLETGDEFDVVGIAPEEECRHEMFVMTRWRPHELAVLLMQVEGIHVDEETQQAIKDWHYWVNQGYEF